MLICNISSIVIRDLKMNNKFILALLMLLFIGMRSVYAQLSLDDLVQSNLSETETDYIDTDYTDFNDDLDSDFPPITEAPAPMKINNITAGTSNEYFENNFPTTNSPMEAPVGMQNPTPPSSGAANESGSKIDKDVSLTDIFDGKASIDGKNKQGTETWLDRLRSNAESEIKSDTDGKKEEGLNLSDITAEGAGSSPASLRSMLEGSKSSTKRSNAAVFDIAGAMLRMTPAQIDDILTRKGYRKTNAKFEIPNFIRWRKEDECRAAGVVGYERLASCVVKFAKQENYEYLETVSYSKYDTQEEIIVRFTSNFTGNKAYKITYTSSAANITGNSQKAIYLRNIKIYDFWKQINRKFGVPDNKDDVIWGLGGNKPYMQASTGRLVLVDPMLRELDYTRMSREDQKFIHTGSYNF